jgi:alpha-D-ribose 1-methylphosphonate 5-triphosphate synthase subunit PhnL
MSEALLLPDPATTLVRLIVHDLAKTFTLHQQGGVRLAVLGDAHLRVEAGECVALTGASGSGKSTLLRCLFGNYAPSCGQVWMHHRERHGTDRWVDVATAGAAEVLQLRRQSVGWVSQFLRVVPRVPAIDIVAEPLVEQGVAINDARDGAAELLNRLHVPERLWSLAPATFSGGEQQRVNVARGLAADHHILLVDEPTASLDRMNRNVVIELLMEARERGTAVIGIFHDVDVRSALADREIDVTSFTPEYASHD